MDLALVFAVVGVGFIASSAWGMITDGTVRRPPSEWLASLCLAVFAGLLVTGALFLDTIRAHLVISSSIGIVALLLFLGLLRQLWKTAKRLDQDYFAKRSNRLR
jgi:hypothetical protein